MSCLFVVTTLLLTCGLVLSTAGQQELSAISDDVYRLRLFQRTYGEHPDIVYRNSEGYDPCAASRRRRLLSGF